MWFNTRNESLLILNNVTSAIRFIWTLEQAVPEPKLEEDDRSDCRDVLWQNTYQKLRTASR
jgi:hypothetical protein